MSGDPPKAILFAARERKKRKRINHGIHELHENVFNHGLPAIALATAEWTRIHTDKNNVFKQRSGRNINSLQVKSTPFPLNRAVQGSKRTLTTESQLAICQT
jgi:hypothetical protein